jgi:altronate dehydratase
MPKKRKFVIIDPSDNVATAIIDIAAGTKLVVDETAISLSRDIPFGHKFALKDILQDGLIIKYGARIGRATEPISMGDHVHVHNVEDIVDEVRKDYGT